MRAALELQVWAATGKTRIRRIQQWIETLTCADHHYGFNEPMFALDNDDTRCDLCALPQAHPAIFANGANRRQEDPAIFANCYSCDRRLGKTCGCAGLSPETQRTTCAACTHKETFFVVCSCGVDECYNYYGINPKLETYFLCRRHKQPLADRCVQRVKCATCKNKVAFPFCEKCDGTMIPDKVRCNTCVKWNN
jgi:hypothetical protein